MSFSIVMIPYCQSHQHIQKDTHLSHHFDTERKLTIEFHVDLSTMQEMIHLYLKKIKHIHCRNN